jgi:hypothetical protein
LTCRPIHWAPFRPLLIWANTTGASARVREAEEAAAAGSRRNEGFHFQLEVAPRQRRRRNDAAKRFAGGIAAMGKGGDLWDDSALVNAFDRAVSTFKVRALVQG